MPNYDISRVAFDPKKHYTSVRMQQGRVLMDDDWNESERIDSEELRRTQLDIIGPCGTPDDGFKVDTVTVSPEGFIDFNILAGTIYLSGLRLVMDEPETFRLQKDWLEKDDNLFKAPALNPGDDPKYDLVYLEAWQQPVCAVEDTSLFEKALGGPDTTTRVRNMRRIRLYSDTGEDDCAIAWKKLRTDWETELLGKINNQDELTTDALLTVSFSATGDADDICTPATVGGYLGAENQAIRVQITGFDHATNSGTFTWGFDNASPLYRVTVAADGTVEMLTAPKDQYHWPLAGQVVEILPWSAVLPNNQKVAEESGFLSKVSLSYDPTTRKFKMATPLSPADFGMQWTNRKDSGKLKKNDGAYFYMRVWNRGSDTTSAENISFNPAVAEKLGNTGLEVTFSGTQFTSPDETANYYWVIAARPSTPDLVVPWEFTTTGLPPNAVREFYAPLAVIKWTNTGVLTAEVIHDCRKPFNPLTAQDCCCTFTVGDGVTSSGDFNSIQDAIDALPADGGKICILRGVHEANAVINQLKQITIYGCGEQSIVCPPDNNDKPIFLIRHSQFIKIENLTLFTVNGIAIDVEDDTDAPISAHITVKDNRILALIHAVRVYLQSNRPGNNAIEIIHNLIGMYDKKGGNVAIFSVADDVLIDRNRIVIIPPPRIVDIPVPQPPDGPFDPCDCLERLKGRDSEFKNIIWLSIYYINTYVWGSTPYNYGAPGGIQIGGGSERVFVLQNTVIGGSGNGITLGHTFNPKLHKPHDLFATWLYEITIDENVIREMGLSGIGTILHPDPQNEKSSIHIEDLVIFKNSIAYCVQGDLDNEDRNFLMGELPVSAISLAYCEDTIISHNWLEDNGRNQPQPVCGIYIFVAERVDISNNRIVDNGPDTQRRIDKSAGVRGGIVIWYAYKVPRFKEPAGGLIVGKTIDDYKAFEYPTYDGSPAAKIHDNIVTQPIGQALFIIALGPVSVVSNEFTSQGINLREPTSQLAGCIFIFDLGLSKDIFNILFMPLAQWGYVNPSVLLAMAATASSKNPSFFKIYEILPSGKVMYSANQSMLDMRGPANSRCVSADFIFSLDDIAFVDNQAESAGYVAALPKPQVGYTLDFVLVNTMLFSISTRCNDNRFTDGFSYTLFSLFSFALMNTAIGNQSTHCIIVPFWAYRRKALNIELDVLSCEQTELETRLSRNNKFSVDQRFNYSSF